MFSRARSSLDLSRARIIAAREVMTVIACEIAAIGGGLTRGRRMSCRSRKFHQGFADEVLANDNGFVDASVSGLHE